MLLGIIAVSKAKPNGCFPLCLARLVLAGPGRADQEKSQAGHCAVWLAMVAETLDEQLGRNACSSIRTLTIIFGLAPAHA